MSKEFELTRRRVLAGLGTIGVTGAAAGLGTSAYLSDDESFENNAITAGELNLVVDWYTGYQQGSAGSGTDSGTMDGNSEDYVYEVSDAKPGDSGTLAFCPKIVDNPGWLWVGSEFGLKDFENGQTEPEAEVDGSGGDPGQGAGELSESIQVTVSYASNVEITEGGVDCDVIRELNNPDDYTLADLASDLEDGFLIDGDFETEGTQAYPASSDGETQNGPCLCIDWEIPTSVGNEIQTDSVELGFSFTAMQERHNPGGSGENPYNSTS